MFSPDVDLDAFTPSDPQDASVFVQVLAGPADGPGEESFNLTLATPRALGRLVAANGPFVGRHYVVIERWDLAVVRRFLIAAFEREEASDWATLTTRLARIGHWEFEDYRP